MLLNRTDDVSNDLSEDIHPARVAAGQLQAALRDQETGTRGYLISADRQFLTPYYDGQRAEKAAAEDIRRRVANHPDLIADLDAIETGRRRLADKLCRAAHRQRDPEGSQCDQPRCRRAWQG